MWRVKEDNPPVLADFLDARNISVNDTAACFIVCSYFVVTVYTTVGRRFGA